MLSGSMYLMKQAPASKILFGEVVALNEHVKSSSRAQGEMAAGTLFLTNYRLMFVSLEVQCVIFFETSIINPFDLLRMIMGTALAVNGKPLCAPLLPLRTRGPRRGAASP